MTEEQQPSPGPQTPSNGATYEEELRTARMANRFDIRRIIGGLFAFYGVVLAVVGLVGAHHIKVKASGININSGAILNINSGGVASSVTVNSGGLLNVSAGGTTVSSLLSGVSGGAQGKANRLPMQPLS